MMAVFLALRYFLSDLRGYHVHAPSMQFGAPDTPLGPGQAAFSEGSLHPWAPESESRHLVEAGAEPRGMETPCRLEVVRPGGSGLFALEETHCPLWFFLTHTVPLGLDVMVQT